MAIREERSEARRSIMNCKLEREPENVRSAAQLHQNSSQLTIRRFDVLHRREPFNNETPGAPDLLQKHYNRPVLENRTFGIQEEPSYTDEIKRSCH